MPQKKEVRMKKSAILVIITFFIMLSYFSIEPLSVNAEENDCILEASTDVIVEVWNVDDRGNKGPRIWKGLIKQGEQKRIVSSHGQIRYAKSTYVKENEPLSGDISRYCSDGKTIGVP
jgi:hypothetical protein